jgi:hypothetical protein
LLLERINEMTLENPCYDPKAGKDCEKRHAGCAADCPEWAKYVEKREAVYEARKIQGRTEYDSKAVGYVRRLRRVKREIEKRSINPR